jgi:hypothetical protein
MVKLVRKKIVVSKREADFKRVANKEFSLSYTDISMGL